MKIPLSGEIKEHKGTPAIFVNGEALAPIIYALTDVPGGRWTWEELPQHSLRVFAEHGFRLYQVDLFLEHMWFEDGTFDVDIARKQIRGVLDVCPDAALFFRLHVNAPLWWTKAHPEEWTRYADVEVTPEDNWGLRRIIEFDNSPVPRVSLASEKWRQQATEKTIEFCRLFADTPEGDALVGLHMACGVYGEWHYWAFLEHEPDISEPMNIYFRQWLKDRYRSNEALQTAWHSKQVTLATAVVPNLKERRRTKAGLFRDPQTEKNVIDYYECQHQLVADNIIHFCRIVKETWPRQLITGTFYGYFFATFGRQAAGGHLQLERVLNSEYIDYLSGPQCYYPFSTEVGGAYRSRSLIETCRLHGKLWLDEMDQKPDIQWDPHVQRYEGNLEISIGTLRRNLTFPFTHGMGLWLYDFGVAFGNTSWWDHPALMAEIKQLKELCESYLDKPFKSDADVLVVYDTDCFYYLAGDSEADPISSTLIDETMLAIYLSGVACDPVHIMDLERIEWQRYRVVVFANTFLLNAQQREFIRKNVARDGRHLVWFYAPGYCDGQHLDVGLVSETVGINLEKISLPTESKVTVEHSDWPPVSFGVGAKHIEPLFVVTDSEATPLGHLAGTAHVAFAKKELGASTSWYCSLPIKDANLMRKLFEDGGAHIYGSKGDVFYSGGGILCVHTKDGGRRNVMLRNGRSLVLELSPGSTELLDSESGEKPLN